VGGDVLVEIYTDFPERLKPHTEVFLGGKHLPLTIRRRREHNEGLLLAFEGYTTPEEVGKFRNQLLYTSRKKAPQLAADEFYQYQLIGLKVETDAGEVLGTVTDVIETGANDVYEVKNEAGREILLPATAEVILKVDLDQKLMRVHLLPGLLQGEEKTKPKHDGHQGLKGKDRK
jgi:16S rRNA processing protein RimM